MKRHWITRLLVLSGLLLSCAVSADPGALVSVAATGGATNYDINVWLNARAPATGQQFHISSGTTLAITPLVPKGGSHCYNMGLEVTTPGYRVTSGATGQVNGVWQLPLTCTGQAAAVVINGEALTCKGAGGACRVFVTATTTNGTISAGNCNQGTPTNRANCICAADLNKPVGAGTYAAWLSTSVTSASSNIQYSRNNTYVRSTNPASIVTGPLNNNFPASLLSAVSAAPAEVWSGTLSDGTADPHPCKENTDWDFDAAQFLGISGDTSSANLRWTESRQVTCNILQSLYCFEVPAA